MRLQRNSRAVVEVRRYSWLVFTHPEAGPLLFAHRGLHTHAVENTMAAFQYAIDAGADVLELDVRLTRDGEIVVFHDEDGQRLAGKDQTLTQCNWEDVAGWHLSDPDNNAGQARPCRFEDLLYTFPEVLLNVDLKDRGRALVEAVRERVQAHAAWSRVLLTSFYTNSVRRVRAAGYPGPTGLSQLEATYVLLGPRTLMRAGWKPAGRRLQIPLSAYGLHLDTRAVLERAHRFGYFVDYWVVDDPGTAERLLDCGADGIVTDNTPAMAELFSHHSRTEGYRKRHGIL